MRLIPRSRGGALVRFALGAFVVIAFTATTAAVAGLLQFKQLATDISANPALKQARVTIPNPGDPQTILAIGSDHRAGTPWSSANTDTMMLIRLDPSSSTINVISVPRDLKVNIMEHGVPVTAKLNSAYSVGGPNLLVQTIQQNVFPNLVVNHIVDVNFGGFEALVNALGCVYTDVDHRYYNNTALTDYSSINIQPGYQKLCGAKALAFVRFRHTDNDIVRNARQQDFVRWAEEQYGQGNLISNRDTLLHIFGEHTQTDRDLHTTDGLINLFNLVAFMDGHTIRQVPFPAILQTCVPAPAAAGPPGSAVANAAQTPCYVTADQGAEQHAFVKFMAPTTSQPVSRPAASVSGSGQGAGARRSSAPPDLVGDAADGKAEVGALRGAGMPVYFPRLIAPGSQYCTDGSPNCPVEIPSPGSYPHAYTISDPQGDVYHAYRMTLVINLNLGEYYGIQGTSWQHAPLLDHPTTTQVVNGRTLLLYANGGKLSVVAWKTSEGVYWVSNTLTDTLSNQQMVGIAGSFMRQ